MLGCGGIAILGWLLSAFCWWRVVTRRSDHARLDALQEVAFVMTLTCIFTAGAAIGALWHVVG